jgi:hypothetical protein
MKRAGHKTDFVLSDDVLVGIFLAADFTAEHEWGIESILHSFAVDRKEDEFGAEPRRVTAVDNENIFFLQEGNKAVLLGGNSWWHRRELKENGLKKAPSECRLYEKEMAAAWDGTNFMVHTVTAEATARLKTIYQAFLENDILIMLGGQLLPAFDRGGLSIGIISKIPQETKDHLYECDEDAYKLKEAAKATGIYEVVSKDRYMALSPRWCWDGESDKRETKYDVVFWLNPTNQKDNAYGYFTVEELTAWIAGEAPDGPIAGRGRAYETQKRIEAIARGDVRHHLYSDEVFCTPCMAIHNTGRSYRYNKCPKCGNPNLVLPVSPGA